MVNVDKYYNSLGVSEILFKHNNGPAVRTGLVSGMVFMSGAYLIFVNQSGNTIRLNAAA